MHTKNKEIYPEFCPNDKCGYYRDPPADPRAIFYPAGIETRGWFRCRACRKKFRARAFARGYHGLLH